MVDSIRVNEIFYFWIEVDGEFEYGYFEYLGDDEVFEFMKEDERSE